MEVDEARASDATEVGETGVGCHINYFSLNYCNSNKTDTSKKE